MASILPPAFPCSSAQGGTIGFQVKKGSDVKDTPSVYPDAISGW